MPVQTDADQYAEKLIVLLKEYTDKIRRWSAEVSKEKFAASMTKGRYFGSPEWHRTNKRYRALQGPLEKLTRESSQLSEQGAVEDGNRIELSIRRAELEGLMSAFEDVMKSSD